jgi:hypothetical protein
MGRSTDELLAKRSRIAARFSGRTGFPDRFDSSECVFSAGLDARSISQAD